MTEMQSLFDAVFFQNPWHHSPLWAIVGLANAIINKQVVVTKIFLPKGSDDLKFLYQFSGQREHQGICSSVAIWLEQQGKEWTANPAQCWYAGGIADVIALDSSVYAEAGHTRADKVVYGLRNKNPILLAPYYMEQIAYLLDGGVSITLQEEEDFKKEAEAVKNL